MNQPAKWKKIREKTGRQSIYRLLLLNTESGFKKEPELKYEAIKNHVTGGKRRKISRCFKTFKEASSFLESELQLETPAAAPEVAPESAARVIPNGPPITFRDLFARYEQLAMSGMKHSSRRTIWARKRILGYLMRKSVKVEEMTPELIDRWLIRLKDPRFLRCQHSTRATYAHEHRIVKTILNFYRENWNFRYAMPVLKRHGGKALVVKHVAKEEKDLFPFEHEAHVAELAKMVKESANPRYRAVARAVHVIAQLQYCLLSRISEAAALKLEDANRAKEEVTISRHFDWDRVAGGETNVVEGMKRNDWKTIPSPLACRIMSEYAFERSIRSGFLFEIEGKLITYRQIQYRYDKAFRRLKMAKSGTHVVRHGSGSQFHELNGGDLKKTAKALGHSSLSSTEGYVRVRDRAFNESMSKMDDLLQGLKSNARVETGGNKRS